MQTACSREKTFRNYTSLSIDRLQGVKKCDELFLLLQKRVSSWNWTFKNQPFNIYFEEWGPSDSDEVVLFLPALSDVSTTDEFRKVAEAVAGSGRRAVALDWPGFGLSGRPQLEYSSDLLVRSGVYLIHHVFGFPVVGVALGG